jgi:hypothetical protein
MAIVIDVPVRWGGAEDTAQVVAPVGRAAASGLRFKRCQMVNAEGGQCRWPIQGVGQHCWRHRTWNVTLASTLGIPYVEDAVTLQEVILRTIAAVIDHRITLPQARVIADLCRTMRKNLRQYQWEAEQSRQELLEHEAISRAGAKKPEAPPEDEASAAFRKAVEAQQSEAQKRKREDRLNAEPSAVSHEPSAGVVN